MASARLRRARDYVEEAYDSAGSRGAVQAPATSLKAKVPRVASRVGQKRNASRGAAKVLTRKVLPTALALLMAAGLVGEVWAAQHASTKRVSVDSLGAQGIGDSE